MAKFKNLLLVSSDFTKIPNKFLEIFSKDYNEMVVLIRLMNTMEIFNNWGKLQEDKNMLIDAAKSAIELVSINSRSDFAALVDGMYEFDDYTEVDKSHWDKIYSNYIIYVLSTFTIENKNAKIY